MLGDDSDGSFNLHVVNATKDDEAKYECQVGPGRGNPPIRASAFLTVNCKQILLQLSTRLPALLMNLKSNLLIMLLYSSAAY